jgi:hypothetical protein
MLNSPWNPVSFVLIRRPKLDHECVCVLQFLRHDPRIATALVSVVTEW